MAWPRDAQWCMLRLAGPCHCVRLTSNVRRHNTSRSMRLFVYGTLAPGRPNAHVLSGIAGTWQMGSVRGQLLDEGWGAKQGFPGLVIDRDAGPVQGYVLSSAALENEWARLDAFEGEQYERVAVPVELEDGEVVQAFVYQLRR